MVDLCVQGNCSSALPVGLAAYIAADSRSSSRLHNMQPSPEPTNLNAHLDDTHDGQLTHEWPAVSAQHSSNSSSSQRAVEASPALGMLPHGSSSIRRQLGVHANAAWQPAAELPGCGPLLPSWRQLTDLLVPLLHHVRACCTLPNLAATVSAVPVRTICVCCFAHTGAICH